MSDTVVPASLANRVRDTALAVGVAAVADPGNVVQAVSDAAAIVTPATRGDVRLAAIEDLLGRVVSFLHAIHPTDAPRHFGS